MVEVSLEVESLLLVLLEESLEVDELSELLVSVLLLSVLVLVSVLVLLVSVLLVELMMIPVHSCTMEFVRHSSSVLLDVGQVFTQTVR